MKFYGQTLRPKASNRRGTNEFLKARSLLILSSTLSLQVRVPASRRISSVCPPSISLYIFLVSPSSIHPASSSICEDLCCCLELRAEAGATNWWRRPETIKGEIHVSRLCYPNNTIAESLSAQPGKYNCGSRQGQRSFDFIRWFWLTSAHLDSFWGIRLSKS